MTLEKLLKTMNDTNLVTILTDDLETGTSAIEVSETRIDVVLKKFQFDEILGYEVEFMHLGVSRLYRYPLLVIYVTKELAE